MTLSIFIKRPGVQFIWFLVKLNMSRLETGSKQVFYPVWKSIWTPATSQHQMVFKVTWENLIWLGRWLELENVIEYCFHSVSNNVWREYDVIHSLIGFDNFEKSQCKLPWIHCSSVSMICERKLIHWGPFYPQNTKGSKRLWW